MNGREILGRTIAIQVRTLSLTVGSSLQRAERINLAAEEDTSETSKEETITATVVDIRMIDHLTREMIKAVAEAVVIEVTETGRQSKEFQINYLVGTEMTEDKMTDQEEVAEWNSRQASELWLNPKDSSRKPLSMVEDKRPPAASTWPPLQARPNHRLSRRLSCKAAILRTQSPLKIFKCILELS